MFIATPQSINAVIGTQASFNCTASGVIAISWLVNENSVQGSELIDSGIDAIPAILAPGVRQSILTILADSKVDNTTVQCIVIDSVDYQNHPSEIAKLNVKGTLTQNTTIHCVLNGCCCCLSCEILIIVMF